MDRIAIIVSGNVVMKVLAAPVVGNGHGIIKAQADAVFNTYKNGSSPIEFNLCSLIQQRVTLEKTGPCGRKSMKHKLLNKYKVLVSGDLHIRARWMAKILFKNVLTTVSICSLIYVFQLNL